VFPRLSPWGSRNPFLIKKCIVYSMLEGKFCHISLRPKQGL
jgi:hypothetical protein